MNRSIVVTGLFALTVIAIGISACSATDVTVDNAWIRTPRPGMTMTAAYLDLHNPTAETITLVGATADDFGSVTIHESRVVDGIWKMTPLTSVKIEAGEQLHFRPGGLHLMMEQAKRPVSQGDRTTIRLQFADGRLVTVPAVVHDSAP